MISGLFSETFVHRINVFIRCESEILFAICCIGLLFIVLFRKWSIFDFFVFFTLLLSLLFRIIIGAGSSRYYYFFLIPSVFLAAYAIEKAYKFFSVQRKPYFRYIGKAATFCLACMPLMINADKLIRYNRYSDYAQRIADTILEDMQNYPGQRIRLFGGSDLFRLQYYTNINDNVCFEGKEKDYYKNTNLFLQHVCSLQGTPAVYYVLLKVPIGNNPIPSDKLHVSDNEWTYIDSFFTNNRKKDVYQLYRLIADRMQWVEPVSPNSSYPDSLIVGGDFESRELKGFSFISNGKKANITSQEPQPDTTASGVFIVSPGINSDSCLLAKSPSDLEFSCQVEDAVYSFCTDVKTEGKSIMRILFFPQDEKGNRITSIDYAELDIPEKKCFTFSGKIDLSVYPKTKRLIILFDFVSGEFQIDNITLTATTE